MKVSLHVNGKLVIRLEPENDIEALIMGKMQEAAEKGQPVSLSANGARALEVAVSQ